MKRSISLLTGITLYLVGCHSSHDHHHHGDAEEHPTIELLAYSKHFEVYLDFDPLISGRSSTLFVHLTQTGELFTAVEDAALDLTLEQAGNKQTASSNKALSPGIFELDIIPAQEGYANMQLSIRSNEYTEQVKFDAIKVYPDRLSAIREIGRQGKEEEITYLKNQAWKIAFANALAERGDFHEIFKTSGQILPAPGDETVITANASGTVFFSGNKTVIGSELKKGDFLFTISGAGLTEGNPDLLFQEAKNRFTLADAAFQRAQELIKDQIISQKDFLDAQTAYENSKNTFEIISRNFSSKGQQVLSPGNGYLKNILVSEGQVVNVGTPLAYVSKNNKLLLQALLSQKHLALLSTIRAANFKVISDDRVYTTDEMNGRVLSYARSADNPYGLIPIIFEINNIHHVFPGTVAEVYLKTGTIPNALTIPLEAVMEELGNFYVFVQTNGERFQKREVQLAGNDGKRVQVLSGITEGERVVTKGAYAIKLASATGEVPDHGHAH